MGSVLAQVKTAREWRDEAKYNPFNSDKGLTYCGFYVQLVDWFQGKGALPPPVEVNLDIMAHCNLDCYYCITQSYLKHHRERIGNMIMLPLDYMLKLVDFLAAWGVKGLCISGGGEPTLHKDLPQLVNYAKDKMEVAVVTNATRLFDEFLYCRWVAFSVDASCDSTYQKIKRGDRFHQVIKNIESLAIKRRAISSRRGESVDLCFKFLVLPENQYEIFDACRLAKELGVQDFHVRPCDLQRQDMPDGHPLSIDIAAVHEQYEKCHQLETEQFRVFTVQHKFDAQFHVKYDYKSCWAAPLVLPILQDGNAYICVEHKMEESYRLVSCFPEPAKILDWWGKDAHRRMLQSIVPPRDCSRCVYSQYNKQVEQVILRDGMCRSFP